MPARVGRSRADGRHLREGNRLDEARAKYAAAVKVIDQADVPQQVKDAAHWNHVFEEGRLAAARGDLATARTKAADRSCP